MKNMQIRKFFHVALIFSAMLTPFNILGGINLHTALEKIAVLDGFDRLTKEQVRNIIGNFESNGEMEGVVAPNSHSRKEVIEILKEIPAEYFIQEIRTENDKLSRFYVMPNDKGTADFMFAFIGKGGNDLAIIRLTGESESYYLQICNAEREITYDEFEETIAAQNAELPINVSDGIQMTGMYVNPQYMTIRMKIDTKGNGVTIIDERAAKENGAAMLTGSSKQLISQIFSLGLGLKVVMTTDVGNRIEILFNRDELSDILNDEQTTAEDSLNIYIKNNKNACPITIGNGMDMTDIYKNGGMLYIVYDINEELYSIANFSRSSDVIKENMKSILESGEDQVTNMLLKLLQSTNHGLVYRYKGNSSGDIADIVFTADEIAALAEAQ